MLATLMSEIVEIPNGLISINGRRCCIKWEKEENRVVKRIDFL